MTTPDDWRKFANYIEGGLLDGPGNHLHRIVASLRSAADEIEQLTRERDAWRHVADYYLGDFADAHSPEECRVEAVRRSLAEGAAHRDAAADEIERITRQRDEVARAGIATALALQTKLDAVRQKTGWWLIGSPPGAAHDLAKMILEILDGGPDAG